jgi:tetratricopeptide (TPR) repeat protein
MIDDFLQNAKDNLIKFLGYGAVIVVLALFGYALINKYQKSELEDAAIEAYDSADYTLALKFYNQLIADSPDNFYYHYKRACVNQESGKFRDAIIDFTFLINNFDDDLAIERHEPYFWRADCLEMVNDYQNAIKNMDSAISLKKDDTEYLYRRAALKKKISDINGAINDFSMCIQIDQTEKIHYKNRAASKLDISDYRGAILDYKSALALDTNDISTLKMIAIANMYIGNTETALLNIDNALLKCPHSYEILVSKGDILSEAGKYEESLILYNQAVDLNPNDAFLYYNRAEIKLELNKKEEARDDFLKAFNLGYFPAKEKIK